MFRGQGPDLFADETKARQARPRLPRNSSLKSACTFNNKCYHLCVNSKHRSTLVAIFTDPVSGNLPWNRIEALLVALGCTVIEGNGSSVTFEKNGRRAYFHRPHPNREALRYRVKAVREFLLKLEILP